MTMETLWEGPRPAALSVRGPLTAPVYIARVLVADAKHGVDRTFLGRSILQPDDTEQVIVPVSELRVGDVLEIREGLAETKLGPYDRFAIWDGKVAQRVEIAYALHALQAAKWKALS